MGAGRKLHPYALYRSLEHAAVLKASELRPYDFVEHPLLVFATRRNYRSSALASHTATKTHDVKKKLSRELLNPSIRFRRRKMVSLKIAREGAPSALSPDISKGACVDNAGMLTRTVRKTARQVFVRICAST